MGHEYRDTRLGLATIIRDIVRGAYDHKALEDIQQLASLDGSPRRRYGSQFLPTNFYTLSHQWNDLSQIQPLCEMVDPTDSGSNASWKRSLGFAILF